MASKQTDLLRIKVLAAMLSVACAVGFLFAQAGVPARRRAVAIAELKAKEKAARAAQEKADDAAKVKAAKAKAAKEKAVKARAAEIRIRAARIRIKAAPIKLGAVPVKPGAQPVGSKPMPLVNADEERGEILRKAKGFLDKKDYETGIEVLQALINLPDSGFVPTADGRRYVSLWRQASSLIGSMPPEGLKLYRSMYDPQANELYKRWLGGGDVSNLRELVRRYVHTTQGPKALDTLGAFYFDRGRFYEAARYWQQMLAGGASEDSAPLVLAKIAVACHLAGEADLSDKAAAMLRERFGGASAEVGGSRRSLVEFVAEMRKLPAMRISRRVLTVGWPGQGALLTGLHTMDDCDVVLAPQWRRPEVGDSGTGSLSQLIVSSASLTGLTGNPRYRLTTRFREGRVLVKSQYSGRSQTSEFALPAIIRPVVVGETVIFRTGESVRAFDALTGLDVWKSVSLPMFRQPKAITGRRYYGGYYPQSIVDRGRYALTVGGGCVYVVHRFRRPNTNPHYRNMSREGDTSALAALDLGASGRLAWSVGNGAGDDELLREGKFLTAPTYSAGRLYAIVMHVESYHLVCLDAEARGRLLWKAMIAQVPVIDNRYGRQLQPPDVGGPPAVAEGRVFVANNAGVIAAFDTGTGQPIWAYQYDSNLIRRRYTGRPVSAAAKPSNPIILTRGRVICLPADSKHVIALSSADGSVLWPEHADRRQQSHLTAIDENRILLSGQGMYVLNTADGKCVAELPGVKGVNGRPAVTRSEILAGGPGRLFHVDLDNYSVRTADLIGADSLLGNLVSVGGRLFAANAAGVCAYFSYEDASRQLTERIEKVRTAEGRFDLLVQRAQLAFNAARFPEALADLESASLLAHGEKDAEAIAGRLRPWMHRTCVALGNVAGTAVEMRKMFEKAATFARTEDEKAHMKLRLAKCRVRAAEEAPPADRLAKLRQAVAMAWEIGEKYGKKELVDVRIGREADFSVRFREGRKRIPARVLAQDHFIGELIGKHGQEVYAEMDAMAQAELKGALAADDAEAMASIPERYKHSSFADDALLAASESHYRAAKSVKGKGSEAALAKAVRHLSALEYMQDSELRASAQFALAMIYNSSGQSVLARIKVAELANFKPKTPIRFAGVSGTLDDLLKKLRGGSFDFIVPMQTPLASMIRTPLRRVFAAGGRHTYILRDAYCNPIRLGQCIFIMQGSNLVMLNTAALNAKSSVGWVGVTGFDEKDLKVGIPGSSLMGALDRDSKTLVIVSRSGLVADSKGGVVALDVRTGKVKWKKTMAELGIKRFGSSSTGHGVLILTDRPRVYGVGAVKKGGGLICLELASGKVRWRAALGQGNPSRTVRIGTGVVAVCHNFYHDLSCYNIHTGKLLKTWHTQHGSMLQAKVSPEGVLVVLASGELLALDPARIDKPLWALKKYARHNYPAILAVSSDRIVVSPSYRSGEIEVFSITRGGQTVAKLATARIGGRPAYPVSARFDARGGKGGNLYVTCSLLLQSNRENQAQGLNHCGGLNIQKFDVAKRDPLWQAKLDDGVRNLYLALPITIGKEHLVVTARQINTDAPAYHYILGAGGGKVRQKIEVGGKQAAPEMRASRIQGIGPAAMTHGRLCVETIDGVAVYGGR